MKLFASGVFYHLEIHQNRKGIPYLFLMHGFMGSGSVFSELIDNIRDFCNPVTIDLLGHGDTEGSDKPGRYSHNQQVSDLSSILDRLAFDDLYIYAYSMGGRLALHLVMKYQKLCKGLILESTGCGIEDNASRNERKGVDEKRAIEIKKDFDSFVQKWNRNSLFQSSSAKNSDNYLKHLGKQVPEYMAASLKGFGSGVMPPVCNMLEKIHTPCLLLAGSEDQKYRLQMSQMKKIIPEAELTVIEEAGHRAHFDQPKKIAKIIQSFLS